MLKSLDHISVPKLHSIFAISKRIHHRNMKSDPTNPTNAMTSSAMTDSNIDYLTKILRVTSEFVNLMTYNLTNHLPPSNAQIADCKQKMSTIAAAILSTRSPPNTENTITDSKGDVPSVQYDQNGPQGALLQTIRETVDYEVALHQIHQKSNIQTPSTLQPHQTANAAMLKVDYTKIRGQLTTSKTATTEQQTALLLLLQSLRWRVTKLIKHHEKRNIVLEYIRNDLLQCHDIRIILHLLTHSNVKIIETSLRLLNVMASFATGRGYLLKTDHTALINALSHILTGTTSDDPMRMNSLGCLQKLSLRRELQDVMIEKGLIGWIIEMLHSELDELSEYTVEYSTGLFALNMLLVEVTAVYWTLLLTLSAFSVVIESQEYRNINIP